MALGGLPIFDQRNLLYGGDGEEYYLDPLQLLNADAMGGGLPASPDSANPMVGGMPFDPVNADLMAGGLPASPGAAPPLTRTDPMAEYRQRAGEIYNQAKKRSRIESLLTIIQPLAKSFGAAMAQPGFRRNRVFWGNLAGQGATTALGEAMRPRILKQQAGQQAWNELYRMAQLRHEGRLAAGSQTLHPALDTKTQQKVFITTGMQQADPSRYAPIDREGATPQPVFRERVIDEKGNTETDIWSPKHGAWIPTGMIAPTSNTPTVAGPVRAVPAQPARVPFISRKGDVAAAKEQAKKQEPNWKQVTLADNTLAIVDMNGDSPTFGTPKKTKLKGYSPPRPERETEIRRELTEQAEGLAGTIWDQAGTALPGPDAQDPVKVANKALELARAYPGKSKNTRAAKLAREIMPMIEARIKARLPVQPPRQGEEHQFTLVPVLDTRTGQRTEVFHDEIANEPGRYRVLPGGQ